MKTYAIADIHGRYDLLEKALELIESHSPEGGRLVITGDFVDRGFQSKEVIQRLMAGPSSDKWEWIVLQGNHEDIMLQGCYNPACFNWWVRNGGGATLKSYGYEEGDSISYPLNVCEIHLVWIRHLPVYFEDEHRIFVHAGVPHLEQVSEARRETLQWMLYKGDVDSRFVADLYDDRPHISGKHLVHGHHQSENHPLLKPHRTNLDSFAWYTGRLSIGVFNDEQAEPIETLEVRGPTIQELRENY